MVKFSLFSRKNYLCVMITDNTSQTKSVGKARDIIHIIARNSDCPTDGIDRALTENVYAGRTQWTRFLNFFLVGLGVAFSFSGIVFFFAYNWNDLHRFAKMGTVVALVIACVATALLSKENRTYRNIAITGASLLVGALFAVFGQVYQTNTATWELFFIWTIFIAAWVIVADFTPLWLLFLALINATVMYCWEYRDDILLYDILFIINAGFVIACEFLPRVCKLRKKPEWLLYTVSLIAVLAITLAVITCIIDTVVTWWFCLLAIVFALGAYAIGLICGMKRRNTFYLIPVAVSFIAIVSTLLVKGIDDPIVSTFITGIFIIGCTIAAIRRIINLNKQWHGNKQ
jgi:uncharacterized membrane protein